MSTGGSNRIAERYTRALFDLAEQKNQLDAVERDLNDLRASMQESKELQEFIDNPLLSRHAKAKAMKAIVEKMQGSELTRDFIERLSLNNRLEVLPQVAQTFARLMDEKRGVLVAKITAAYKLSASEETKLKQSLATSTGREVELLTHEDASLLGGLIVEMDGKMLDYSVRGRLNRLKKTLKAA